MRALKAQQRKAAQVEDSMWKNGSGEESGIPSRIKIVERNMEGEITGKEASSVNAVK